MVPCKRKKSAPGLKCRTFPSLSLDRRHTIVRKRRQIVKKGKRENEILTQRCNMNSRSPFQWQTSSIRGLCECILLSATTITYQFYMHYQFYEFKNLLRKLPPIFSLQSGLLLYQKKYAWYNSRTLNLNSVSCSSSVYVHEAIQVCNGQTTALSSMQMRYNYPAHSYRVDGIEKAFVRMAFAN